METFADIWPFFAVGIAVAAFLVLAFWAGMRVMDREGPPPAPEDHPRLPDGGPVREVRGARAYVDFPKGGLGPHEMMGYGNFGSRSAAEPEPEGAADPVHEEPRALRPWRRHHLRTP
ncbi:DUF6479 family protein [Streptomyces sp. NPDC097619]|uniref:DUF6479 family protein n=1 Tax=Streptomyces sp. NPDC097619 TaxID=3157228 RepID=UPI00332C7DAD